MVLFQKSPFFQVLFFGQYRPGKCLLRYSRTKKNAFLAYKKRRSKSRKIEIFPKGLTYGFGPRMASFSLFLGNIGQENVFYDIIQQKNSFLGYKNQNFKKTQKWTFFQRG